MLYGWDFLLHKNTLMNIRCLTPPIERYTNSGSKRRTKRRIFMFCYQCQETVGGVGCTKMGACGKSAEVADIQDLMVYVLKGYSYLNQIARKMD